MKHIDVPEPSGDQIKAVSDIVKWFRDGPQEYYLAGYAGTGKTTTAVNAINQIRDRLFTTVACGAYTGKAANVLRNRGIDASTIHAMLYTPRKRKKKPKISEWGLPIPDTDDDGEAEKIVFKLDRNGLAAQAGLVVIDECSMVPDAIASDLRSIAGKILILGDPGQLPPVKGTGAFTSRDPDFFLKEIHRQAAESPIIRIATMAREGRKIPIGDYGDDVRVLPLTRENQRYVYDQDAQAICGVHRVRWVYTQRIRKQLGFEGPAPMPGERVICRRNSDPLGIFNGALGTVLACDADGSRYTMSVRMDDLDEDIEDIRVHPYLFQQHFAGPVDKPAYRKGVHEFDWANLLTCHSAQGSGFQRVTVVDDSHAFRGHRAEWLYTAATRAEEGLTLLLRE